MVFEGFGRFPVVFGRLSQQPDFILESVFLWLCFCRQKPPSSELLSRSREIHTPGVQHRASIAQGVPRSLDPRKIMSYHVSHNSCAGFFVVLHFFGSVWLVLSPLVCETVVRARCLRDSPEKS